MSKGALELEVASTVPLISERPCFASVGLAFLQRASSFEINRRRCPKTVFVIRVTDRERRIFPYFANPLKVMTQTAPDFGKRAAMRRTLVWIEESCFLGFGCSQCGWRFKPSGGPTGTSFDEMMDDFELQRNKAFSSHVCADHPKEVNLPRGTLQRPNAKT